MLRVQIQKVMHPAAGIFFGFYRPTLGTAGGTTFQKGTSQPYHRLTGR